MIILIDMILIHKYNSSITIKNLINLSLKYFTVNIKYNL